MTTTEHELVEALYRVEGKAEISNGEIVHLPLMGYVPSYAVGEIAVSLRSYVKHKQRGHVSISRLGFIVDLPHRKSFVPDAAYFVLPPSGMKFVNGSPNFAVEVRRENDYGPAAERAMAAKRADYFAAGTRVVWDVDLLAENVVRVFRDGDADQPAASYRRGQSADAEPAVPGWKMSINELFEA